MINEEKRSCEKQNVCHICKKHFCTDENNEEFISERKVRDHCHYTGKYRGAARSKCNLNYKTPK